MNDDCRCHRGSYSNAEEVHKSDDCRKLILESCFWKDGVCGMEFDVINFDEELKNFKPALEVEDAEDAIYSNDAPDVTDLINMIMEKLPEKKN